MLHFPSARWHPWCSNICDLLCFLVLFTDITFDFSYIFSIGPRYLATTVLVPCFQSLQYKLYPEQHFPINISMHNFFFHVVNFSNGNSDSHYIWSNSKCLGLTPMYFCYFVPVCSHFSI